MRVYTSLFLCMCFVSPALTAESFLVKTDLRKYWDTTTPLANPHKGWYHHYYDNGIQKYLIEDDAELLAFPGMDHLYLRLAWSYLEPKEGQYHWEVVDRIIRKWTALGFGISFRISCRETGRKPIEQQFATPKWVVEAGAKGDYFYKGERLGPEGPWEPQFNDPIFLKKLDNFLKAFGERYDGKPWLRYVDIGSIGDWGEGHTSSGSGMKYGWAERKAHIDMHLKYFRKTQLVTTDDFVYCVPDFEGRERLHNYVLDNNITYRDDSILVDWYVQTFYEDATVRSPRYFDMVYEQFPTILELQHYPMAKRAGNWVAKPGSTLAKKGDGKTGADIFREAIDRLHATYIGYHGLAREWLADNPQLTGELLNQCGYWYFPFSAQFNSVWTAGTSESLKITWENKGAARAYVPFMMQVRLEGPQTVDFSMAAGNQTWKPKKKRTQSYQIPLAKTVKPGHYHLKFKLVCPQTKRDVAVALQAELKDAQGYYGLRAVRIAP